MNKFYKRLLFISWLLSFSLLACQTTTTKQNTNKDNIYKDIAIKLAKVESSLKKKTVAVYGFEMIGRANDSYSRYATEKLTHELVESGKLLVIERSRINKVLKEQQLAMTGIIDANMAAKIGKILAVEGVIIGSINVNKNEVELIARVIQSETAIILKSANFKYKTDSVQQTNTTKVATTTVKSSKTKVKSTNSGKIDPKIYLTKRIFSEQEKIEFKFSGLPGNKYDWITMVDARKSDNYYGQWFYTKGKASGKYIFNGVKKGNYEIRIYYNWPAGGYIVQRRYKFRVK